MTLSVCTHEALFKKAAANSPCTVDGIEIDSERNMISIPWIPMINQVLGDEVRLRHRAGKIYDAGLQSTKLEELTYWRRFPVLQLATGWNKNIARRGMLIYLINRTESFKLEIQSVRESRIQRQYALSSDRSHTASFFGSLNHAARASRILRKRNEFRPKWAKWSGEQDRLGVIPQP